MNRAIPKAKLSAPRLSRTYPRARLFEQLDAARKVPLIWLSATAGAGKTSLVASWVKERGYNAHWYRVDEGDVDVATFFYYLGQLDIEAGGTLPLLTSEYLAGLPIFTRNFFRELFARIKPPGILVLDNFQDVGAAKNLHEVLQVGCAEIPTGVNVIVISREDPPPAFARLRANGALALLGWDQLRLTAQESSAIAHLYAENTLNIVDAQALYTQTDGWVAGLVLLAGQGHPFVATITGHPERQPQVVFDYFTTEIFKQLDQDTQCLLTYTALLPRVTPVAAQALSGIDGAATILQAVYQRNFFTVQHPGPVYEYHHLFRAFLCQRLNQSLSVEELNTLYRRAAQSLVDDHRAADAVELLLEIEGWEVAVPLILQQAQSLLEQGRGAVLVRWLDKLPDTLMRKTPWVLYWRGMGEITTSPSEAQVYLERAYARFKADDEFTGMILSWSGVVDSFVYELRCLAGLDHWIAEATAITVKKLETLPKNIRDHFTCGLFIALMFRQPQHLDISQWAEHTLQIVVHGHDPWLRTKVAPFLVMYYTTVNWKQAKIMLDALHGLMGRPSEPAVVSITWAAIKGLFQAVGGNVCEAVERLHDGLSTSAVAGIRTWEMLLLSQAAIASLVRGGSAEDYLQQMRSSLVDERYVDWGVYHYIMAWQALAESDVEEALVQAQLSESYLSVSGTIWFEVYLRVMKAQCLFSRGDRALALALIETCATRWSLEGHAACLVGMAKAWFEYQQGNESASLTALRSTLITIAGTGDYVSSLLPQQQAALYGLALVHGIETEYVQRMIRKLRLPPAEPQHAPENWPFPVRVYTLGRFSLLLDGHNLIAGKRVQTKPLELLKLLIALGGRGISDVRLEEILWPNAEGDAAHRALITNLQRLRKLLGLAEAIDYTDAHLSLSTRHCWVDTWAFERAVAQGGQQELAQAIYKGAFLSEDSNQSWFLSARERLQHKYTRSLTELGAQHIINGNWDNVIELYQRGLDVDDTAEVFYQGLMQAYARQGQRAEMEKTYRRCRQVLTARFSIAPSSQTSTLYRQLCEK